MCHDTRRIDVVCVADVLDRFLHEVDFGGRPASRVGERDRSEFGLLVERVVSREMLRRSAVASNVQLNLGVVSALCHEHAELVCSAADNVGGVFGSPGPDIAPGSGQLDANRAFQLDAQTFEVETTTGLVRPYTYSDMTGAGLHLVSHPPVP